MGGAEGLSRMGVERHMCEPPLRAYCSGPQDSSGWAATGCLALKHKALPAKASLFKLLHDESYDVRLVAAKALSHMLAETSELLPVIIEALEQDSETIFYRAWDTLRQFKDQDLEPFNHKLQNLNLKHWRFMKYMNPFLESRGLKPYDWQAAK